MRVEDVASPALTKLVELIGREAPRTVAGRSSRRIPESNR
jgi:hypothetical protein